MQRNPYIAVGVRYERLGNGVMHTNYVCVWLRHKQLLPFCFISENIHSLSTLIKQTNLKEHVSREILSGIRRHACVCVYLSLRRSSQTYITRIFFNNSKLLSPWICMVKFNGQISRKHKFQFSREHLLERVYL